MHHTLIKYTFNFPVIVVFAENNSLNNKLQKYLKFPISLILERIPKRKYGTLYHKLYRM